jgi:hypothetical protein
VRFLALENIVNFFKHVSSGDEDKAFQVVVFHELIHALGSAKFTDKALALGVGLAEKDRSPDSSTDILLESLTTSLEKVANQHSRTYEHLSTFLVVKGQGRPVTWRQFGKHMVHVLGEKTIQNAMFKNHGPSVQAIENYVNQLLIQHQPERLKSTPDKNKCPDISL